MATFITGDLRLYMVYFCSSFSPHNPSSIPGFGGMLRAGGRADPSALSIPPPRPLGEAHLLSVPEGLINQSQGHFQ